MKIISVNSLKVSYGEVVALEDVSFDIKRGDFIGIIGPNGGGKTTLVKTLLGLIEPVEGEVAISDDEVIGYVPQITKFDRNFPISVKEVILTGHLPKKIGLFRKFNDEENNHALEAMRRLKIEHLAERQIGELSGGQLQRVLLARALMNHPTILILDEPTSGVDQETKRKIYQMLEELNKKITILIVSHDTSDLLKYIKRIIYINKLAHIHDEIQENKEFIDKMTYTCPIDWFVKGEDVHKNFVSSKGDKE